MDYEQIRLKTLDVYRRCAIHSFPIDCFELLDCYQIPYLKYSEQSKKRQQHCHMVSDDAFTLQNKVYYNEKRIPGRIRFSLMHELGHIVLEHSQQHSDREEQEANFFASHMLAPRMAIYYAKCKNQVDVSKLFELTNECAQYAFDDYRRWHRRIAYYKMRTYDKELYQHFYNRHHNKFIYSIKECSFCHKELYNCRQEMCSICTVPEPMPEIKSPQMLLYDEYNSKALIVAEDSWLYGGIE